MKMLLTKKMYFIIFSIYTINASAQTVQVTGGLGGLMTCGSFVGCTGTISGGTAPYTTITQGVTIQGTNIQMIPPGTTAITIKDINGISTTTNVSSSMSYWQNLCQPARCTFDVMGQSNVTTYGGNDGRIQPSIRWITPGCGPNAQIGSQQFTVTPLGGIESPPKHIGQIYSGLTAGSYYVKLYGSCTGSPNPNSPGGNVLINITQPSASPFSYSKVVTQPLVCNSNGSISITPSGGVPPYSYIWGNGLPNGAITNNDFYGTYIVSNIPFGSPYSLDLKDQNNQRIQIGFQINNVSGIGLAINSTNAICNSTNGTATVVATGGTLPYSYDWHLTPNQTTATATGLAQGSYNVTVTDANGCAATTSRVVQKTIINLPTNIRVKANAPRTASVNKKIEVTVNGVVATGSNYTFLWSTGETTESIFLPVKKLEVVNSHLSIVGDTPSTPVIRTPAPPIIYRVTVTDVNGCKGTAVYTY